MVNVIESVSTSYPAVAQTVPRTRRQLAGVAASAGASPEQLDRVRLAVSEAVTNAVEHAYPSGGGVVHVTAVVIEGRLSILIADDGCGLGGSSERDGLGVGLAVAARMCDGFTLAKRSSGGVEVRMRFDLSAAACEVSEAPGDSLLARAFVVAEGGDAFSG